MCFHQFIAIFLLSYGFWFHFVDFPPTFNVFFKLNSLNVPENPFVKIVFFLVSWEFFSDLSVLISFFSRIVLSLLTLFFRVFVWKVFLSSVTFRHFLISILWTSVHFRRRFSKLCWIFTFLNIVFIFIIIFFMFYRFFQLCILLVPLKLFPKLSIIFLKFLLNLLMIFFNGNRLFFNFAFFCTFEAFFRKWCFFSPSKLFLKIELFLYFQQFI